MISGVTVVSPVYSSLGFKLDIWGRLTVATSAFAWITTIAIVAYTPFKA